MLAAIFVLWPVLASAGQWGCDRSNAVDRVLLFRGGVDLGEFARFQQAFADCFPSQYQGQRTVDLWSNGGYVHEAHDISRVLVAAGKGSRPVMTRVSKGSYCISACTFIFISGRLRDVATGSSFEPHGFSSYLSPRIDDAIDEWNRSGNQDPSKISRTRWIRLVPPLATLATSDPRFLWAGKWAYAMARTSATVGAIQGFAQLSPAQREFLQSVDGVMAVVLPEIERVAALKAFEPLLAARSGQSNKSVGELDEKFYLTWARSGLVRAADGYLRSLKDTRKPEIDDDFNAMLLSVLREVASGSRTAVTDDHWPFLSSIADQVDLRGLVTLMFSTSILYTRPLSREEMCDLNVVNRDCSS